MLTTAFVAFLAAASTTIATPVQDLTARASQLPTWSVTNFKIDSRHVGKGANQFGFIHYQMHVAGSNSSAQCDVLTDSDAVTMCKKYQSPMGFTPHGCDGTTVDTPWSWTLNVTKGVTKPTRDVFVLRVAYDAPGQYPLFGCTELNQNQTCTKDGKLVIDVPSNFTLTTQRSSQCLFA